MFNVHMLPAKHGDAILVEYGEDEPCYMLIDGGPYTAFPAVLGGIRRVAPGLTSLELLVVTHVDTDHIEGIVTLLNRDQLPFQIKEIWFNGYQEMENLPDDVLGAKQGEMLSYLIKRHNLPHNKSFEHKAVMVRQNELFREIALDSGMKLTLLAPNLKALLRLKREWESVVSVIADAEALAARLEVDHRYDDPIDDLLGDSTVEELQEAVSVPDTAPANCSSIAFLAEYDNKRVLFAGDAPSRELMAALEAFKGEEEWLYLDAWKLAHHGSKRSTTPEMMAMINCQHVLLSADGSRNQHPDQEVVAKLLLHQGAPINFYFNYKTSYNEMWDKEDWKESYGYETVFPKGGTEGLSIEI